MENDMRKQIDKVKNFGKTLNENKNIFQQLLDGNEANIDGYNYKISDSGLGKIGKYNPVSIGDYVIVKTQGVFNNNEKYHVGMVEKVTEDGIVVNSKYHPITGNWQFNEFDPRKVIWTDNPNIKL